MSSSIAVLKHYQIGVSSDATLWQNLNFKLKLCIGLARYLQTNYFTHTLAVLYIFIWGKERVRGCSNKKAGVFLITLAAIQTVNFSSL